MRFSPFKVLALAGAIALAAAVSASAAAAPRQVPVSSDIQAYYTAHGVDQTLQAMVESYLQSYVGAVGDNDYLVLGRDMFSFVAGPGEPSQFTVTPLSSDTMKS